MRPFNETPEFCSVIDEIFRGHVSGGAMGNVINGADLDRREEMAYLAGNYAYEATGGNVAPALLAMVLNATLGGAKESVFNSLTKHGLKQEDIDAVFLKDGEQTDFRALWNPEIGSALAENFVSMSETARVAVLAHTMEVLDLVGDEYDPAPSHVRAGVGQTAKSLLAIAKPERVPLADQLQQKLLDMRL
ncbi:MAG TPA: hypothetical protein VFR09_09250 [Alphaproteobacteria bacterium]|nr:hypothetical protein [Alphaproteobacteria bacterium]